MKMEIGSITEKIAVIVFVPMLISLSTLKRKTVIRVEHQRRCIHAGGSSVPLLVEMGPPLDERRMWKSAAHSAVPRVSARELGSPRLEWADKRRAFIFCRVCSEVADIEIDNTTDCNLISEKLFELFGFAPAVPLFNGKLEATFNEKNRKIETLGYIRANFELESFQQVFTLILVVNGVLDSDVILRARELKECHGLIVSDRESVICSKTDAM